MSERPYLSVVIPAYNAARDLSVLLPSIETSVYRDFEVLVVDDRSTDGTAEKLAGLPVRVYHAPRNGGPALARNLGAREARGEIILFLDSDVIVHPETLGEVARFFRDHRDRSVLIGVYDAEPANPRGAWAWYKALQCYSYYWRFPEEREVTLLWAAVAAFRRGFFLETGGFDTRFRKPSMEDLEFGRRLSRRTPIWISRRVSVKHHFPSTLRKNVIDHFDRGRLWVRIWFRHRTFDDYLSTPRRGIGRLAVSAAALLAAASFAVDGTGRPAAVFFALYLACNWDLWAVVARRRPGMLPAALGIDLLLGVVLGAAAFQGVAEEAVLRFRRLVGRPEDSLEPLAPDSEGEFSPFGTADRS
ncbi:MAG: glycosyltransferase family A protein [Candidatus Eisenbacteria bacterium]